MPHIFPPTKWETRWRALGYLFVAAVGFFVLWDSFFNTDPDPDPGTHLVGIIREVWAAFMVTAIPTAVSVYRGRYRMEAILLPVFGSALAVACLNGVIRIFSGEPDIATRVFIALALLCFLIVRGLQLHRIVRGEPWPKITTGQD